MEFDLGPSSVSLVGCEGREAKNPPSLGSHTMRRARKSNSHRLPCIAPRKVLPLWLATFGLVLLVVLPGAPAVHIVLSKMPPFLGKPYLLTTAQSGCGGTPSVVHPPTFNLSTGLARFESRAIQPYCPTFATQTAQVVSVGVQGSPFNVASNATYNISARWTVSGVMHSVITRGGTYNGSIYSYFQFAASLCINDSTTRVQSCGFMPPVRGNSSAHYANLTLVWNHIQTIKHYGFLVGHQYEFQAYIAIEVMVFSDPSAGSGSGTATFDLFTFPYRSHLVSFNLVQ